MFIWILHANKSKEEKKYHWWSLARTIAIEKAIPVSLERYPCKRYTVENWRRREQRSGNEGRGGLESLKIWERMGEGEKGKKEDAKGQSGRRVLKDRVEEKERTSPERISCFRMCIYIIYIYKILTRMLPWKEVGELSKNDCTFRGSARSRGINDGRSRFHVLYTCYAIWWKLYAWNEKITQFISPFIHPLFVSPFSGSCVWTDWCINVAEHFSPRPFSLFFSLSSPFLLLILTC